MNWKTVTRSTGEILMHENKPVWIVHYPATYRAGEHWQAYKSVQDIPKGRMPWAVDNRRVGPDAGFASVEAAKVAGDSA